MNKIKCVIAENGTIIPIHSITAVSSKGSRPRVWTVTDNTEDKFGGHCISGSQYDTLLKELELI